MSSEDRKNHKTACRNNMAEILSRLNQDRITAGSASIVSYIIQQQEWQRAVTILAYLAFPSGEVNVDNLIVDAIHRGKVVGIPRVAGRRLVFHRVDELGDYELSRFGIREPSPSAPEIELNKGDHVLVIVPGLAFDRARYRLGRGGGYYDRFISLLDSKGVPRHLLGVCFHEQVIPAVPRDDWDRPVDRLVTDQGVS